MHFLSLRMDKHAQYEIRVYADAIADFVKDWVPHTWEAFSDYRLGGRFVSRHGVEIIQRLARGEAVTQEGSGLSGREWRELMAWVQPDA